jgi:Mor family transcriptional regulator
MEIKTKRNKQIRKAIKSGRSYREVGKKYSISGKRVFDIVNKQTKKSK